MSKHRVSKERMQGPWEIGHLCRVHGESVTFNERAAIELEMLSGLLFLCVKIYIGCLLAFETHMFSFLVPLWPSCVHEDACISGERFFSLLLHDTCAKHK